MKHPLAGAAMLTLLFAACNNTENKVSAKADSSAQSITDTSKISSATPNSVSVKNIVDNYLQLKNALNKDNDKDAAGAGGAMVTAFANFPVSALRADQKKVYMDIQDDAKEHAVHISKNAGNIKHQREHFDMLSKDIYELAKSFGAGQSLYYDHCPMYNNGKGANWLSESKEIHNPYLGKAMPDCGTVKETLQ